MMCLQNEVILPPPPPCECCHSNDTDRIFYYMCVRQVDLRASAPDTELWLLAYNDNCLECKGHFKIL